MNCPCVIRRLAVVTLFNKICSLSTTLGFPVIIDGLFSSKELPFLPDIPFQRSTNTDQTLASRGEPTYSPWKRLSDRLSCIWLSLLFRSTSIITWNIPQLLPSNFSLTHWVSFSNLLLHNRLSCAVVIACLNNVIPALERRNARMNRIPTPEVHYIGSLIIYGRYMNSVV
jgi:hypothetical protein